MSFEALSLIVSLYTFYLNPNVSAQRNAGDCMDQVGPSGQSDCQDNKDHCLDPVWRDFMEEQCPVTCGVCTPDAQQGDGNPLF